MISNNDKRSSRSGDGPLSEENSPTAAGTGRPHAEKRHATQQSLNGAIKSLCDIMRRSNCAGALARLNKLVARR